MEILGRGGLKKMTAQLDGVVRYSLCLNDQQIALDPFLGKRLRLEFLGAIHCTHCGRRTNKSFAQGYCYPCFSRLPQCDRCIVSPETCHYEHGTCRDPLWGEQFCHADHLVYLANSSGLKVGVTRATQTPTRWIDQGACQALPILRTATRQLCGLIEDLLRRYIADRTNWRAMLKNDAPLQDLIGERERLWSLCGDDLQRMQQKYGLQAIQSLPSAEVLTIRYPVRAYPEKIVSLDFHKTPVVDGTLQGIKGQYLLFDTGVLNIRKFTAYQVAVQSC